MKKGLDGQTYPVRDYKKLTLLLILFAILATLIIVQFTVQWGLWNNKTQKDAVVTEKETLSIFYPTGQNKLGKKTVEIVKNISEKEKANVMIKELKNEKCIPAGMKLYEFTTDADGIIYLNLSKDIMDDKSGTIKEITMTYGIVNTFLLNFKDTKKVQLLVEGKPVYTINGVIYMYMPMEFNKDLMED